MNNDEYNKLFHELELNQVAFKPLMQCEQEVLKLVNAAIAAEREACAKFIEDEYVRQFEEPWRQNLAKAIRAMGAV